MLSLLLLAPPIGVVVGYLVTALLSAHVSWHWAFYWQAVVSVGPTCLGLAAVSEKYFDIEGAVERKELKVGVHARSQTGGTHEKHGEDDFGLSAELFAGEIQRRNNSIVAMGEGFGSSGYLRQRNAKRFGS